MSNKKSNNGQRKSLLTGASILAAAAAGALGGGQALAQDSEEDVIVVTGSRIPQPNLTGTTPVTQVTAEDIAVAGVTRIEDLTNQLPQVFAAQGANVSNGATGTAQVDLRFLGPTRTLVLINGRRMPYGSPNSVAPNLNTIPAGMVERVEVLTGGASAVYGSDAIAGVVNFIMRDDFEGLQIDAQYGFYQHTNDSEDGNIRQVLAHRAATNPAQFQLPPDDVDDGYGKDITITFGASTPDGRGNVTAYLGYRNNEAVLQRDRDFSACAIRDPNTSTISTLPAGTLHWNCGGSPTSFPGYFGSAAIGGAFTIDQTTGDFIPFNANNDLYNFGPTNYFQRPDERYILGAFARYQINDHVEAYAEAMFMDYDSTAQIAPSGNFFAVNQINCGNPLLPGNITAIGLCSPAQIAADEVVTLYIGRRNVEGGGRRDQRTFQSYRIVGGARGPLTESWDYDVSGSFSRTRLQISQQNDLSQIRIGRALDVVDVGGVPTCRSVVDGTDPNCVPWDIFSPNVTPEALAYIQIPLFQTGFVDQNQILATATGDLGFGSPAADSDIQASFGIEYRRDSLRLEADAAVLAGDGIGFGASTNQSGVVDVFEIFGETRIPLIEGAPFADLLSVELAYRNSEYNTGVNTDTYKVAGEWAPVEDIRFRAAFQRAVRAANILELFAPQVNGLFALANDPCDDAGDDGTVNGSIPAQCIGTNPWQVTLAQSQSGLLTNGAGQYNARFGGNTALEPEESDTITYGVVFQPSFLPGFDISLDYFDIDLTGTITALPAAGVTAGCYSANDLGLCALINRNPGNGRLFGGDANTPFVVQALNTNIGGLSTSGIDLATNYRFDVGSFGSVGVQLLGTWLDTSIVNEGGTRLPYDCVGKWAGDANCGQPTPEWRHRFRANWETPWDLNLNFTWRYFGEVHRETNVGGQGGFLVDPTVVANQIGTIFDAHNLFDVSGDYQVFENTNLRFGVNNIMDEDPPLSTSNHVGAGSGNGNTFPQFYDALGRWVFAGVTVDF